MTRPKIVCLCGSTRFKSTYEETSKTETIAGRIVLSVGFFGHQEDGDGKSLDMMSREKVALDELHFRKIDLADEILVLNDMGGKCPICDRFCTCEWCPDCSRAVSIAPYIGESTRNEIAYATKLGKPIRYMY